MIKKFEDFQKLGKDNVDLVVKSLGTTQKGAQAIATEVSEFSKKSLDAGSALVEKLLGVKTLDKAVEIQTEFAKSSYEGFVAHATKVGELYTNLAKEVSKPFEAAIASVQAK